MVPADPNHETASDQEHTVHAELGGNRSPVSYSNSGIGLFADLLQKHIQILYGYTSHTSNTCMKHI